MHTDFTKSYLTHMKWKVNLDPEVVHRNGVASLRVILSPVGRGEHLSAVSARRRAEVGASRPGVGAVDVPAVLRQVPHRLPVAVGAVINLLLVLFLDVDPKVLLAREELLALFALQKTVFSLLFCTALPI